MSIDNSLQFRGVGNLIEREYRNLPAYQWARELAKNGIEHGATQIEFGPEWQGVASSNVYRLRYADNGSGMSREDLRGYMRNLGEGGKQVGGPHDNYAMGSRLSLLPWNPLGVVVLSLKDGVTSMVKLMFDMYKREGEGEYVLEEVEIESENGDLVRSTVYGPYPDDELGFDWEDVIPDFVREVGHGTVFVLLGKSVNENTVMGDVTKAESQRHLGRKYFNNRFWDLPEDLSLTVFEMPEDPARWPRSPKDASFHRQNRRVRGAKHFTEYPSKAGLETVKSKGTVTLPDNTKVHWWLRSIPKVETGGIGMSSGFIGILYRDELYAVSNSDKDEGDGSNGATTYRQFGISSDTMRKRITLVIEPPEYNEDLGTPGVAPSTGRADLYWMGSGLNPTSVKPGFWAQAFNDQMPQEIIDAVSEETLSGSEDEDRQDRFKRVADRFAKRWRIKKARITENEGDTTTHPTSPGASARTPLDVPPPTSRKPKGPRKISVKGRKGKNELGAPGTPGLPAKTTFVSGGVPAVKFVSTEDLADEGMLASWTPPNQFHPDGCIQVDETHPVLVEQIKFWQSQYAPTLAVAVEKKVKDAYADVAVAKVSHIHALAATSLFSEEQRDEMLKNHVLTASLLGLVSEDSYISPQLGGLGSKRKKETE
jgi:hypothetical protein